VGFVDNALVVIIICSLILAIWSKISNQRIVDTLYQLKEFIQSFSEER